MTRKGFVAPFRVPVTHSGTKGLIVLDQIQTVDKIRLVKRLGLYSEHQRLVAASCSNATSSRMKLRDSHSIPLSKLAVAILNEPKVRTGMGDFIFPAIGNKNLPVDSPSLQLVDMADAV
jgi:hypothetical protein